MVGARSLGCSTCKRRKVKCDERHPICANCERGGHKCSGPKSRFIRVLQPGMEEHMSLHEARKGQVLVNPKGSRSETLAFDLVERLGEVKEVGYQIQHLGAYFAFLPSRVGHNAGLDAALRCFLSAHRNLLRKESAHVRECEVQDYNQALRLIRQDIEVARDKTPSETVCAAMILASYEFVGADYKHQWFTHAGGAAEIIRCWGPKNIRTDFDLALVTSHFGSTVATSIIQGKDCFLESQAWDAVRIKCLATHPALDEHFVDLFTTWASLPRLLRDIRSAVASGFKNPEPRESIITRVRLFKARLSGHAAALRSDLKDPTIAFESPSLHPPWMRTKYGFRSKNIAYRYHCFWMMTILSNTILTGLGEDGTSLATESQEAAEGICRSIEHLSAFKPFGVLFVLSTSFAAYGVSSTERREWIIEAVRALFHHFPVSTGPYTMQIGFSMFTAGLGSVYLSGEQEEWRSDKFMERVENL